MARSCEALAVDPALQFDVKPELGDSALVVAFEGWNDAGEAATSGLRFVMEALRTVPLGQIDPDEFYDFTVRRPTVVRGIEGGRRIEWPKVELSYAAVDASREIVTLTGLEPHTRWRRFCDCIVAAVDELEIKRVVLLGAHLADVVYSQPVRVTGFASEPTELERLGVSSSSYQGPTGILGVLGEVLQARGFDVVSLWAGLPHYINVSPNPRGALALVQKLCDTLAFRVDSTSLEQGATEFEDRISQLVAGDEELSEYVRQLKKREFAQ